MELNFSLSMVDALALTAAMAVLAAVPSTSVMAVVARAASSGFGHGAAMALGVVAGDLVFIALALVGLAVLVEWLGPFFVVVRWAAALYLVVLAVQLWRSASRAAQLSAPVHDSTRLGSFSAGLMITLADQKAVFFYLGFLPAFVSLEYVTALDTAALMVIALIAVGGVKLVYVALADRLRHRLRGGGVGFVQRLAAVVLGLAAVLVAVRG
ncbi:LysE family translocator [Algiphilus sp.]|uniref:LysE family translocator n=1 Tax=Algiphilus sp. TaxID=1872431 RepID=UPI003B516D0F